MSRAIAADPALAAGYTWTNRLVAVVSDGTAVLGLGDIGPRAALPVMEGKSALFKAFGGLDSIPLVLDTTDVDEIVETLVRLRPSFGAVNLEDVAAPRCFELERRLVEALDCPVMHDDQHGTAIVLLAALRGACAVQGRDLAGLRVVVSGAGAAGVACARILLAAGVTDVTCSTRAASSCRAGTGWAARRHAWPPTPTRDGSAAGSRRPSTAPTCSSASPARCCPRSCSPGWRRRRSSSRCPTPTPRCTPTSRGGYAAIVATGRSDFPNQINNVLAFPGVFRGALDAGARRITEAMKLAAAEAIFAVARDDSGGRRDRAEPVRPAGRPRRVVSRRRGGDHDARHAMTVLACRSAQIGDAGRHIAC